MDEREKKILLNRIGNIEHTLKDISEKIKPSNFSWWPFWTGGWMFTLALYSSEILELSTSIPWYERLVAGVFTWIFWPFFAGAWVLELAQYLKGVQ